MKTKVTKTANRDAIWRLPALRRSLIWFKRANIRKIQLKAAVSSPKIRGLLFEKAHKLRQTDLADLRAMYQAQRVSEIIEAPLFALTQVVPGLVRL